MAGSYKTKKRNMLRAFLEKNADQAFTVDEIVAVLQSINPSDAPSRSTVYRLISEFEDQGLIKRFYRETDRLSAFEYLDKSVCERHLHVKCADCGELIHLSHDVSERIGEILMSKERVSIDMADTVLMGRCGKCNKGE